MQNERYILVIEPFQYLETIYIYDSLTHNTINLTYTTNLKELNLQLLLHNLKITKPFKWPTKNQYLEINLTEIN